MNGVLTTYVTSVACDTCQQQVPCNVPTGLRMQKGYDMTLADQVWIAGVRDAILSTHECEVRSA